VGTKVEANSQPSPGQSRWRDAGLVILLLLIVSSIYFSRLSALPVVREECRWARGAVQMIETGDWITVRQQGQIFPERPPMSVWGIAVAGLVRGEVDTMAVRLPSVLAIVLTCLLVYGYARGFISQLGAFAAALVFATMGQVLQIGRMGESESLFTLLFASSLLLWHLAYERGWNATVMWSLGFGFSALAALVKGPQAPVYFVAITAVYLSLRKDWRQLFTRSSLVGAGIFTAIVATWQIPYYLKTDTASVMATWTGLASDRFGFGGLLEHMTMFPLETVTCWLPWSPLLVALLNRKTRELLQDQSAMCTFLVTSLCVTYPSVWFAVGARGRYFMPLYPLVAVLIGLVIERCSTARTGTYPRRAWHQFLVVMMAVSASAALVVHGTAFFANDSLSRLYQPFTFSMLFGMAGLLTAATLWICYHRGTSSSRFTAVTAVACFAGLAYTGLMMNVHVARWNNPTVAVTEFKDQIPVHKQLVSFGPIRHTFAYYYQDSIEQLDWPTTSKSLPASVDYFCFNRTPGDTPKRRKSGRGRCVESTPGTLPFAWEEIASVCSERHLCEGENHIVVLGRVIRPLRPAVVDVTKPQENRPQRQDLTDRRFVHPNHLVEVPASNNKRILLGGTYATRLTPGSSESNSLVAR